MDEKASIGNRIWIYVGKISTLVGLFFLVIQIFASFDSEYKIKASAQVMEFVVPPPMALYYNNIQKTFADDSLKLFFDKELKAAIKETPKLSRYQEELKSSLSSAFSQYVDNKVKSEAFDRTSNADMLCIYNIKNIGSKEVHDLFLEIPSKGYCLTSKQNSKQELSWFENRIEIGSIRPSYEVKIFVWSSSFYFNQDETRLTHPDGVVNIDYARQVGGILAFIDKNHLLDPWFLFSMFMVVGILSIGIYGFLSDRSLSGNRKNRPLNEIPAREKS